MAAGFTTTVVQFDDDVGKINFDRFDMAGSGSFRGFWVVLSGVTIRVP